MKAGCCMSKLNLPFGFFVIFVSFVDKKTIFDIYSFMQLSCRNPVENLSFSSLHGKIAR
jgi:hypothetical protein